MPKPTLILFLKLSGNGALDRCTRIYPTVCTLGALSCPFKLSYRYLTSFPYLPAQEKVNLFEVYFISQLFVKHVVDGKCEGNVKCARHVYSSVYCACRDID